MPTRRSLAPHDEVMTYLCVCVCGCITRVFLPTGLVTSAAACCSVLQCVAACCSVLQESNTHYWPHGSSRWLQHVVACCSMLQCVAVCCSVLQHVVACCSVLQCVAACCSMLQCVAVCCSMLQCVAAVKRALKPAWLLISKIVESCLYKSRDLDVTYTRGRVTSL